jgi:hypothetical protein
VRPFKLSDVTNLLSNYGIVISFWMEQCKRNCLVTYASVEESGSAYEGLYNLQWPLNGNRLQCEYVQESEIEGIKRGNKKQEQKNMEKDVVKRVKSIIFYCFLMGF